LTAREFDNRHRWRFFPLFFDELSIRVPIWWTQSSSWFFDFL
jgi:hypothetical protein